MRPNRDPPEIRFKRPGRTTRVRKFVTSPPFAAVSSNVSPKAATFDSLRLPELFADESIECQRLLEELAAIKAEERARERARRLQAEQEAMRVLNALAHCWRRKKFRKRYYKRKSVTRLQSKFRGNIARKKFVRNVMCRKIQAKHRGKMDRRRALAWKMKVSKAIITIQCAYRCRVAREVAKKIVPLHKRIELKHTRRMAVLIIQRWWVKRKWQLLHSDEFRKKVRRRKRQYRRGGSYNIQTRRSPTMISSKAKKDEELKIKNKAAAAAAAAELEAVPARAAAVVNTPLVTSPPRVAPFAEASQQISPTSPTSPTSLTSTRNIPETFSPSSPSFLPSSSFTSSTSSSQSSTKNVSLKSDPSWTFESFPQDFEKHINHDRAFFEQERIRVGKILQKYDAKVREKERERFGCNVVE